MSKLYSLNTKENREFLSNLLDLEIDEIQLWKKKNGQGYEILYFWPHFWWFKHRRRMDLEVFTRLIKDD